MRAQQWQPVELTFTGPPFDQPYLDVDPWVDFTHSSGDVMSRPAFWDGDQTWRVRFASTRPDGTWTWRLREDRGWTPATGVLDAASATAESGHPALRHGFLRLVGSRRGLVHADDSPALVVADSAWGMPWRARPWRTSAPTPGTASPKASTPSC